MSLRNHSLSLAVSFLAAALLTAAPRSGLARDARAQAADTANASLQAERRKLVGDLERANAEIEQLKNKDRGVRDDYRLRARMADAEAIARRLTEIDAKLGPTTPSLSGAAALRPVAPLGDAAPTDGPAELEARADILTDQSRRLEAQAAALSQRVTGLRNRIELRRRAGQLESDPFAPMEGSKRRLIATVPGAQTPTAAGASNGGNTPRGPDRAMTDTGASSGTSGSSAAPTSAGSPGAGSNSPSPVIANPPPMNGNQTPATPVGLTGGASGGEPSSGPLSAQLHDFVNPGTLAAIRKLELNGTPSANLEAMERAAAALRERAQRLQAQSNSLRDRAHTR